MIPRLRDSDQSGMASKPNGGSSLSLRKGDQISLNSLNSLNSSNTSSSSKRPGKIPTRPKSEVKREKNGKMIGNKTLSIVNLFEKMSPSSTGKVNCKSLK